MTDPAIEAAERVDSNPSPMAEYYFEALILAAREALAPIRDLHKPGEPFVDMLTGPGTLACQGCLGRWPCKTAELIYTSEELNR